MIILKKSIPTMLMLLSSINSFAEKNNYLDLGLGTTNNNSVPMISLYYGHKLTKLNDSITLNGEVNGSLILFADKQYSQATSNATLSAVPMFNFKVFKDLSVDAGIGLSYMFNKIVSVEPVQYRGSNVNFSINTGLRYDVGNYNVMARYQHLSNAGLTYNNYGLNTYNLMFGINF
jgi:hypothetical protein